VVDPDEILDQNEVQRQDGEAGAIETAPVAESSERATLETLGLDVANVEALLADLAGRLNEGFERVLQTFQDKLAYDRTKDEQVARLHDELQEHKKDLLARTALPLVKGLVRLHDDLGKTVDSLRRRDEASFEPSRIYDLLSGFRDDIEIVLDGSGVTTYREAGEAFDAGRQRVLAVVPTDEPAKHGVVAEHIRPGFEQAGKIVRKEIVTVFKHEAPPEVDEGAEEPAAEPQSDDNGETA